MDRVLFLADQLADEPRGGRVEHPGGAELTDAAALRACPFPVEARRLADLRLEELARYDVIVLANAERARPEQLAALAASGRLVSFEHDLRICRWRGNFPAAREPIHALSQRCICPHHALAPVYEQARGVIFLTERQRRAFDENPYFETPPGVVLGSSLFERAALERLTQLAEGTQPRAGALYLWAPHRIKGTEEARAYCEERGLRSASVRNVAPTAVYELMGGAETFVYLPIGLEPAGRMPVEARLAGCSVVVNSNVGVAGEAWWRAGRRDALEQLYQAPTRFWRAVEAFMNGPLRAASPFRRRGVRAVEAYVAACRRGNSWLPPLPPTARVKRRARDLEILSPWLP